MKLRYELYISASSESKNIYRATLPKDRFFNCDALNMSELINRLEFDKSKIDNTISKIIFNKIVLELADSFKHFTFSLENMPEKTIEYLYNFYGQIKNNDVALGEFVKGDKKEDIAKIFDKYESYKNEHNLIDSADIIDLSTAKGLVEIIDGYDSLIIDWQFFDSKINFLKTDKEKKLFQAIVDAKEIQSRVKIEKRVDTDSRCNITLNKAFDFDDESRTAIRLVKELLKNKNANIGEIVVVVSQMSEYKSSIKKHTKIYGLKSNIGKGDEFLNTPVYHEISKLKNEDSFKKYAQMAQVRLDSLDDEFKEDYKLMLECGLRVASKSLGMMRALKKLDIKMSFKDVFSMLCDGVHYQSRDKKDKLSIVEHNQILRSEFKHIIYLGIDSIHLPQRFQDNFLYDSVNAKDLNISNYYDDAKAIYASLKENAQNLYLITANYMDKRELQISSIVSDNYSSRLDAFEFSKDTRSLNDLLDEQKQTTISTKLKSFIASKQIKKRDKYHGLIGENYHSHKKEKGIVFSASKLNTFSDCPLKYYFMYILKASSPSDFNDEEFDSMQTGTLFHSVTEEFSKLYKDDKLVDISIEIQRIYEDEYQKALPRRDAKIYETVFHKQKKNELQVAIDRFKQYVKEDGLVDFHRAEEEFNFEMDGDQFVGFIDRIDKDDAKQAITLIDYKTSRADKNTLIHDKKYEKLINHKEFQLPLYHFFLAQSDEYRSCINSESYLLTFVGLSDSAIKKGKTDARFGQSSSFAGDIKNKIYHFDADEQSIYKDEISTIATKITNGDFSFESLEDSCRYCSYISLCRDGKKEDKKF
ncbi:MAG: PD-(D/E)XK nuclease family protein [Sulfurimonas sp.]|nr:PD-(D/E)XK nuclease family protein [Sulfurimonas sp.]